MQAPCQRHRTGGEGPPRATRSDFLTGAMRVRIMCGYHLSLLPSFRPFRLAIVACCFIPKTGTVTRTLRLIATIQDQFDTPNSRAPLAGRLGSCVSRCRHLFLSVELSAKRCCIGQQFLQGKDLPVLVFTTPSSAAWPPRLARGVHCAAKIRLPGAFG